MYARPPLIAFFFYSTISTGTLLKDLGSDKIFDALANSPFFKFRPERVAELDTCIDQKTVRTPRTLFCEP